MKRAGKMGKPPEKFFLLDKDSLNKKPINLFL